MRAPSRRYLAVIGALWLLATPALTAADGVVRHGSSACKAIALTFDLCPVKEGSGYDAELVRDLIAREIPATFFLSGRWILKHDQEVRDLLAVPFFEVGTHGHRHAHLPDLTDAGQEEEIRQAVDLLRTRYHHRAVLFRPPYGEFNAMTVKLIDALGLRFILWDVISGDPDRRLSREHIVARVEHGVRNGSIIVMHANGKGVHTREVVDQVYEDLIRGRGLRPVTISTLLGPCPGGP